MIRKRREKEKRAKKKTAAHSVELAIIGAGTTGLRTAMKAAGSGMSVALIENSVVGGTCLNFGCIPTKALLQAAHVYKTVQSASKFGIRAKTVEVDFDALVSRVDSIVAYGRSHSEASIKKYPNLRFFKGIASFTGRDTLKIGDVLVKAKKIIIATGSYSWTPPIKGIEETGYLTNIEAVSPKVLPKSLIIIGGGYIAVEFATFFATMGTKVTMLERLNTILAQLDKDVVEEVYGGLERLGVRIFTGVDILSVQKKGKKFVEVKYLEKKAQFLKFSAEEILVAAGRKPNFKGLEPGKAGVQLDDRGFIKVDRYLRTTNRDVYAIGDVNGNAMFAHSGKRETSIVLDNIFKDAKQSIDYRLVPYAVFTDPPVAGVGMAEHQLIQKGIKYKVFKATFKTCGRAQIMDEADGFVKVLADAKGVILGCTIVGPDADNLIHEFIAVMNSSKKIETIRKSIHIHPTLAEVLENLKALS